MFTYKFVGLAKADAETPYYYGSLPVEPEVGHTLSYDETSNRYAIVQIVGEGLVGDDDAAAQKELAWADINRGEKVPTLFLQQLHRPDLKPTGRSFSHEETKEYSQKNRELRLSASAE
jgi:hypothetical protein